MERQACKVSVLLGHECGTSLPTSMQAYKTSFKILIGPEAARSPEVDTQAHGSSAAQPPQPRLVLAPAARLCLTGWAAAAPGTRAAGGCLAGQARPRSSAVQLSTGGRPTPEPAPLDLLVAAQGISLSSRPVMRCIYAESVWVHPLPVLLAEAAAQREAGLPAQMPDV